jgi:NAD-dependent deacetylase
VANQPNNINEQIARKMIDTAAEMIVGAKKIVVFTGTGIATEPELHAGKAGDAVSPHHDMDESFPNFVGDPVKHKRRWQLWNMFKMIESAQPGSVHYAVADIHKMGKLYCVITQNVDGLHQKSGIPEDKVIELHGSLRRLQCLNCKKQYSILAVSEKLAKGITEDAICDSCGGKLKSATVSFGEPPLSAEISQAEKFSRSCDLFMLVGSTLLIYPAAYMPIYAVESGAKLMVINPGTTSIDEKADILLHADIKKVFAQIMDGVKKKLGSS